MKGRSWGVATDTLSPIEIQFMLDWFCYNMDQNTRHKLMQEHPVLYNKLMGTEIMAVSRVSEKNSAVELLERIRAVIGTTDDKRPLPDNLYGLIGETVRKGK